MELLIPVQELRFYDTISETLMVEEGEYQICAGRSSQCLPLQAALWIPGAHTGQRLLDARRHKADHYDDYENILLTEGHFGYTAATPKNGSDPDVHCESLSVIPSEVSVTGRLCASPTILPDESPVTGTLCYRDCVFAPDTHALWLHLKSQHGCTVEILIDDRLVGSWTGDTRAYTAEPRFLIDERALRSESVIRANRHAVYTDVRIALKPQPIPGQENRSDASATADEPAYHIPTDRACTLKIRLRGDVQLCYFYAQIE